LGADLSLKGNFATRHLKSHPTANSIQHYIYGFLRGDTIQGFPVRQFGETNARLLGFDASVKQSSPRSTSRSKPERLCKRGGYQTACAAPFTPPLRGLLRATFQNSTYMA